MAQILVESEALDSLKRMVEELEKDSARLDWLDKAEWVQIQNIGRFHIEGNSRSRIDAAMSKE